MQPKIKDFKRLIDDLGGNQILIANELGMSDQTISDIVNEKTPLKKRHIFMLEGLKSKLNGKKLI